MKQLAYGEVLTTEDVLNRMKEKEEEKSRKNRGEKRSITNLPVIIQESQKVMKHKRQKLNSELSSSDLSEGTLAYAETDDSPWDEEIEEFEDLEPVNINKLRKGTFAIVAFKGGKRMTMSYRYLCMIQDIDLTDGEIKVTSLKCLNNERKVFSLVDTDVSFVTVDQIIGITKEPSILMKGERMYYKFTKALDIFEKA